jgi:hypothetical protein
MTLPEMSRTQSMRQHSPCHPLQFASVLAPNGAHHWPSRARFIAGQSGFLVLIQSRDRPDR